MKKGMQRLSKYINIRYWNAWNDNALYDFSSRAGLMKKVELKDGVLGCAWDRPYNWLHILSNGDIVLCCQDWKRETLCGNILQNKLQDILTSKRYNDIMQKSVGKKESDANFICKRCKLNV
jgi:radical SAM protein with 4Fe4S-binding SPASM domain